MKQDAMKVRAAIRDSYPDEDIRVRIKGQNIIVQWTAGPSEQDVKNAVPAIYSEFLKFNRIKSFTLIKNYYLCKKQQHGNNKRNQYN